MTGLITFNGCTLYEWGCGYKSLIGDVWMQFNNAGKWYQYVKSKHKHYDSETNKTAL